MSQCSERVKHAVPPPYRFLWTFLGPCPGAKRWTACFWQILPAQSGTARQQCRGEPGPECGHPLLDLPRPGDGPRQQKRAIFMRLQDIIYRTCPLSFFGNVMPLHGLRSPKRPAPHARPALDLGQTAQLRGFKRRLVHQKHTNWSQIMHESPQSDRFSGLPCIPCIGDISLCLFLF